eukprot:9989635-Heterocapsa_arctica.AAC.1
MRTDKDWQNGDIEKKMLMIFCHLGSKEMKKERNNILQYGAVRMTRAEAIEMIDNNVRYVNFWIYVTVVEEDDDRGAKTMKLGY